MNTPALHRLARGLALTTLAPLAALAATVDPKFGTTLPDPSPTFPNLAVKVPRASCQLYAMYNEFPGIFTHVNVRNAGQPVLAAGQWVRWRASDGRTGLVALPRALRQGEAVLIKLGFDMPQPSNLCTAALP